MLPSQKLHQRIREDAATEAEPPYWAGNIPESILVKRLGRDHFITTQPGDKFTLQQGYIVKHSSQGSIPLRAHRPAITKMQQAMTFPYEHDMACALADYAITAAAHQNGISDHLRVRIERMDSQSWSLWLDNTTWEDEPPIHLTHEAPTEASAAGALELHESMLKSIIDYRLSPYAIPEHNHNHNHNHVTISTTPAPPAKRKRFRLFR